MTINWTTTPAATYWHALLAAVRGLPIANAELLAKLAAHTQAIPRDTAGEAVLGEAVDIEPFAAALTTCREAFSPAHGAGEQELMDQLRVRSGPIREQWDARGPGLLRQLGKLTEPLAATDAATVALVMPTVGGHGEAFPTQQAVTFEAVLANPHEQLPEVLRLAWLLAQLRATSLTRATQLAFVPAVLAAGEEVELTRLDGAMVQSAIQCWHIPHEDEAIGAKLMNWWQGYRSSLTPWRVAVAGLGEALL